MNDRFAQLLKVAGGADKDELSDLNQAVIACAARYKKDPKADNGRDWDDARKRLARRIEDMWAHYCSPAAGSPSTFNQKEARQWLWNHFGREFPSAGKFNADCKKFRRKDKSILLEDLERYAASLEESGQGRDDSPRELGREKAEWEIRDLKAKVEGREMSNRKEDRRWVLKETAWAQTGALLAQLRDTEKHYLQTGAARLVHAAGGDPVRVNEVEAAVQSLIDQAYNELAESLRFEVIFDASPEESE